MPEKPNKQLAVLVVTPAKSIAQIIQSALTAQIPGATVINCLDDKELSRSLKGNGFDLVVAQHDPPGRSCIEILGVLSGSGLNCPLIAIGNDIGARAAVELIRAGVRDYILVSEVQERLAGCVVREVESFQSRLEHARTISEHAESHVFLRNVVDTVPVEIVVRDEESRILFANHAFAATYLSSPAGVIGELDADLWAKFGRTKEQIADWLTEDYEVLQSGVTKDYIQEIKRSTGETVFFHNIKKPITLDNGKRCVLAVYADITERKRVEEELREAQQRTAELTGIHKTTVTYAHEINNPLAGITALIQVLLEDDHDEAERQQMLREMQVAAKRIQEVIRKMDELREYRVKAYLDRQELIDLNPG